MTGHLTRAARPCLRRLWAFVRLPAPEKLESLRAFVLLAVVEVALRTLGLRRSAQLLSVQLGFDADATPPGENGEQKPAQPSEVRAVRAVDRALRSWPFAPGPCLRRSLVLGVLLRHRHPTVQLGIAREDGTLLAHAWLELPGESRHPTRFQRFGPGRPRGGADTTERQDAPVG